MNDAGMMQCNLLCNTGISEPPPLYLILWNQSQVSGWIDEIVTEAHYHETLVLEMMQPVNKDKDKQVSGPCIPWPLGADLTVKWNVIWVVRTAFHMQVQSRGCMGYMATVWAFEILLFTMLVPHVPFLCMICCKCSFTFVTFEHCTLVHFLVGVQALQGVESFFTNRKKQWEYIFLSYNFTCFFNLVMFSKSLLQGPRSWLTSIRTTIGSNFHYYVILEDYISMILCIVQFFEECFNDDQMMLGKLWRITCIHVKKTY